MVRAAGLIHRAVVIPAEQRLRQDQIQTSTGVRRPDLPLPLREALILGVLQDHLHEHPLLVLLLRDRDKIELRDIFWH